MTAPPAAPPGYRYASAPVYAVNPETGEAYLSTDAVPVGGVSVTPDSTTLTRPADTNVYASGDLVANSTTAGSVVVPSIAAVARVAAGSFSIRRMRLRKSGTSVTNASFRVHLFSTAPTTFANGDNDALSCNGVANCLGAFDITVDRAFTDGALGVGTPVSGGEVTIDLSSGTTIYWVLEARGAYTPASAETFIVVPEIWQD